ncbi:hypothetical protein ACRE_039100 [Hapsidospora chrysogenum ATCC 11550]|uniref:Uncharacterized protein n=1 Tax=Hapsidospora chrysogenum (strain ATCC 11550 / CBS 779.69 / DSM 880 / IAM 14645 / JCM 23072 / IMI 49137) TaxID=857340 RepID=A0A086T7H7_HAPC1|nr:hypothetical protein ACRE_039100 [Hapsidospora chrysogenum ATCC 11550]
MASSATLNPVAATPEKAKGAAPGCKTQSFKTLDHGSIVPTDKVLPVIRTDPVICWKSVFVVGHHGQKINGLSEDESRHFVDCFAQLMVENHDLQVRQRWQNVNDVGYMG